MSYLQTNIPGCLDMVAYACNPRIWDAKAGELLWVKKQHGLHSVTPSQVKKKTQLNSFYKCQGKILHLEEQRTGQAGCFEGKHWSQNFLQNKSKQHPVSACKYRSEEGKWESRNRSSFLQQVDPQPESQDKSMGEGDLLVNSWKQTETVLDWSRLHANKHSDFILQCRGAW